MKTISILFITTLFFVSKGNSQLTKGNWLVGGNGNISFQKQKTVPYYVSSTIVQIAPDVGYFFINKFAGGLRTALNYSHFNNSGNMSDGTSLTLGPFVRYYLLPFDNRINLFAQSTYEYLTDFKKNGYATNTVTFSAGPVIFLNSSVGVELTLNYQFFNELNAPVSARTFYIAAGFQFHLEREKSQ